jgi:hypothetical protein
LPLLLLLLLLPLLLPLPFWLSSRRDLQLLLRSLLQLLLRSLLQLLMFVFRRHPERVRIFLQDSDFI